MYEGDNALTSNFLTSFRFIAFAAAVFVAERSSSAACRKFCCWSMFCGFVAHPYNRNK